MTTSHLEKLPFLTFEQIDYVFALSLDSLNGLITDDRTLLSPETVKDVVQCHLWYRLQDLFNTELPQSMRAPEVIPPWASPELESKTKRKPKAKAAAPAATPPWAPSKQRRKQPNRHTA